MAAETNTLTTINQLGLATGVTTESQLFINPNPANNIIERIALSNLTPYLFLQGDLISNTGGTQSAYNLSTNFAFQSPTGTATVGTFNFAPAAPGTVLANSTTGTVAPTATTVSALLDIAFNNGQGDILYRGATGWTYLAPGTAGKVLQTGGAGANPSWVTPTGGGAFTVNEGTLSIGPVSTLTLTGSGVTLSGASPDVTLTIPGGGGSGSDLSVGNGTTTVGTVSSIIFPGSNIAGSSTGLTVTLPSGGGVPAAGIVSSNGSSLVATALSGLTLNAGTLSGAAVPGAGLVYSNGTALEPATVGTGLSYSAGNLAIAGGAFPSNAPLLAITSGVLTAISLGTNLSFSGGTTLNAVSPLQITDGTHSVSNVSSLTVSGATITGTSPNGTIAISGGSGGFPQPIIGLNTSFTRPDLSTFQTLTSSGAVINTTQTTGGPIFIQSPAQEYNIAALAQSMPTSGSFSYAMLLENLPGLGGPSIYIEDASQHGYVIYFSGTSWYGQLVSNRNTFSSTVSSYSSASAPQTLWYKLVWDATAQSSTIYVSANGINYIKWGDTIPVSGGFLGQPVYFGPGSISNVALGSNQWLWQFSRLT